MSKQKRRHRRTHEQVMDSFWREYEPVVGLLDEDEEDANWGRTLTGTRSYNGAIPKPPRLPGKFDLDRMLWRPRVRFPDFDQVTADVSTGGMVKTVDEANVLRAAGITHVVNGARELWDENEVFERTGIEYLYLPTNDDNTWKDPEWFRQAIDFALPAIAQGGHVYLHCLEGINRGPSLAYAVLREQGLSIHEAHEAISKARPKAKMAYALDAESAREEK